MSVVRVIEGAAARYGSRRFLIEVGLDQSAELRSLSYAEAFERSVRLASGLARIGLVPGDRVAVLMDNGVDMVTSEWACLLSGYLWVALNTRSSPSELEEVLADSRPSVLVVGASYQSTVTEMRLPAGCRRVDGQEALEALLGPCERPYRSPGPEDPVRIRYTSGTSGRPKGAVLARRCYDASVATVARVVGPRDGRARLLQVAPMTHASGAMLLPHAAIGARAYLLDRFEAAPVAGLIEKLAISSVFLVPTMLVRLLDSAGARERLAGLDTVVYGGAAMPVDRLREGLEMLGPVFVQIYGLTESTWPVAALTRGEHQRRTAESEAEWARRLASVGRSTGVGDIRISGPGGGDAATGEQGEIVVRGPNTMSGYWSADGDDHRGLDAEGWMHTGDIGRIDAEGYLTILDRLDDMIVSGGFNVYPREVEEALASHPDVLESAVVGRSDPDWGQRVHACVVLKEGRRAEPRSLIAHAAGRLSGYKKPRSLEILASLPRNPAGKILRRALR